MKVLKNYHLIILTLIIFILSKDSVFFWDNVLFGSKIGHFFYEQETFSLRLPTIIDPGHPPFLAVFMSFVWKYLGHSLFMSHLAMMPFVFGILYQVKRFLQYYNLPNHILLLAFGLIVLDPTISAQLVLINPEVFHLFFFFLALNGLLYDKHIVQTTGLLLLGITSFRGMFLCAGFFTFDILNHIYLNKKELGSWLSSTKISIYVLGGMPSIVFVVWRLVSVGYLQTHPDSPWSDCWGIVSINGFFVNLVVLSHRYLDFGRILVLTILTCLVYVKRKHLLFTKEIKQLILLSVCSVWIIILVSLISINPFGHRYFIISFIPIYIVIAKLIYQLLKPTQVLLFSLVLISCLISGNLWVYPRSIAQGWDASLAHYPYSSLRNKALNYMYQNNIPINKTASFFPNETIIKNIDLSSNIESFCKFNKTNDYVLYSNVYNVDDNVLTILDRDYEVMTRFNSLTVEIELLVKKK